VKVVAPADFDAALATGLAATGALVAVADGEGLLGALAAGWLFTAVEEAGFGVFTGAAVCWLLCVAEAVAGFAAGLTGAALD